MYHRDYTLEIDVPSPHHIVPRPLALMILGAVAAAGIFGHLALSDFARVHDSEVAAKAQLAAKEEAYKAAQRAQVHTRTTQVTTQR